MFPSAAAFKKGADPEMSGLIREIWGRYEAGNLGDKQYFGLLLMPVRKVFNLKFQRGVPEDSDTLEDILVWSSLFLDMIIVNGC